MKKTFDNILEVVNSRAISRKEKGLAISTFLKENSKAASPEQAAILETLKAVRKSYLLKDKEVKQ